MGERGLTTACGPPDMSEVSSLWHVTRFTKNKKKTYKNKKDAKTDKANAGGRSVLGQDLEGNRMLRLRAATGTVI